VRLGASALVLLALVACGEERREAVPIDEPVGSSRVVAATPPPSGSDVYTGVLVAAESVDIAPRAAGVIVRVDVAAGDSVVIGQVVAEMDPVQFREELRTAQAALGASQAAYSQAVVGIEDAKRKLAIEIKAVADGVSPTIARDDAAFALRRAEAAAQQAASTEAADASRVQTAKDHLGDVQLRAPFDGTVALRYRDAGNRVDSGAPVVRVVGTGRMRLRFAVPPERARTVASGARVTARVETISTPVTAAVRQVSPTIDAASGMVIVEAQLDDAAVGELRSGLAARVQL
jgi:RND family efflux transporter MFP subunit